MRNKRSGYYRILLYLFLISLTIVVVTFYESFLLKWNPKVIVT